ncbi:hypothetical protein Ae201684P_016291 [Aphanomyces euteiches]|nr:hypothetical protein Ae201684P_016291 [Aphanomyces euteiches]
MSTPEPTVVPSFVQSLYDMLNVEDASIIRWTRDGTAFEILDQRLLAVRILPRYFRHSKYASFQRQLNYFGFRKWPKQKAAICTYSQTYFARDSPQDLQHIKRKVKADGSDSQPCQYSPVVEHDTTPHPVTPPATALPPISEPVEPTKQASPMTWHDAVTTLEWLAGMDESEHLNCMTDEFLWGDQPVI